MTGPLHLLRPFFGWVDTLQGRRPVQSVREAEDMIKWGRDLGYKEFQTTTRRRLARASELKGGSVYFCRSGFALFRMPFIRIVSEPPDHHITMEPLLIRVEPKRFGMVRGWRYLEDRNKPADEPAPDDDGPPPEVLRELQELGLV